MLRKERLQTGVRSLLVLVACCGAIAWAWRRVLDKSPNATTSDWVRALRSDIRDDRRFALRSLQPSEPADIELAVAAATHALKDPEALVRVEASVALARFVTRPGAGARAPDVKLATRIGVCLLDAFQHDTDAGARVSAAFGLASIYRALDRAGLRTGDSPETGPLAAHTLVAAFDAELARAPANRVSLLAALERLGRVPMTAPPGLVRSLDDPSSFVRGQTLLALSHFSGGIDQAVPILLKDVATNTAQFAPNYVGIAAALHPSPAVVPVLLQALESDDGLVREAAATLLARIEPLPRSAAPALIAAVTKALAAGDGFEYGEASPSEALASGGMMAPRTLARREVPSAAWVSSDLCVALVRSAPAEQSVPLLIQVLNRKAPSSRSAAAVGLAELGPPARAALPSLVATLKEAIAEGGPTVYGYRLRSAQALGRIAPQATDVQAISGDVVAVLTDALKVRDDVTQAEVAEALGKFGPRAAAAVPSLRELLKGETALVRNAAKSALKKIDPQSARAASAT
jgi:HEAT repeat protein